MMHLRALYKWAISEMQKASVLKVGAKLFIIKCKINVIYHHLQDFAVDLIQEVRDFMTQKWSMYTTSQRMPHSNGLN